MVLFNELLDSLPPVLSLKYKAQDLRAKHESKPSKAASELLDVVSALECWDEFFGALKKYRDVSCFGYHVVADAKRRKLE